MKERFIRFMQGRYGVDEFSRFLIGVMIVLWIISIFTGMGASHSHSLAAVSRICDYLSFAAIIYCWYRMFSKNISRRYNENQAYLRNKQKFLSMFKPGSKDAGSRVFKCPNCKQKIRVPKNKGKIAISCPKCRTEFIKRT